MIFNYSENEKRGFIDKDDILKYVSEEDIFELVFGFKPKEFDYVISPFRKDNSAGCWFQYYPSGKLKFTDFGSQIYIRGVKMINIDCFDAVQFYFKLGGLYKTLQFIKKHLIDGKDLPKMEYILNEKKIEKRKVKILFDIRDFDIRDEMFWKKYGISKQNLIDDKVFPIKRFKVVNSKKGDFSSRIYDICYAYTDFEDGRKKLYRPYQKGKGKFLSTCNQNDIGGFNHLPKFGNKLIITKSYKDYRVLKNQELNVVWFQNEGMIPTNDYLLPLCKRFDNIVIFFDNDNTGKEVGEKISNLINSHFPGKSKFIHLPDELLESKIKDPSDLIHKKGLQVLIEFLNNNI